MASEVGTSSPNKYSDMEEIILSRPGVVCDLWKDMGFWIGHWIYWTHRYNSGLQFTAYSATAISHSLSAFRLTRTESSQYAALVSASNGESSTFWVPEISLRHCHSDTWLGTLPNSSLLLHCTHLTLPELSYNCRPRTSTVHSSLPYFNYLSNKVKLILSNR
jgi:hypothetical protein